MFSFRNNQNEISNIKKLERLYHLYKQDMFKSAHSILRNRDDAQDVVQTSIIKISQAIHKIDEIESNKTRSFIITVVRNTALDLFRKKNNNNSTSLIDVAYATLESETPSPEEFVMRISDAEWLASKISEIHPDYADIIMLKYYDDLTDDEISSLLGISSAATRVRLYRARKALKKMIEQNKEVI